MGQNLLSFSRLTGFSQYYFSFYFPLFLKLPPASYNRQSLRTMPQQLLFDPRILPALVYPDPSFIFIWTMWSPFHFLGRADGQWSVSEGAFTMAFSTRLGDRRAGLMPLADIVIITIQLFNIRRKGKLLEIEHLLTVCSWHYEYCELSHLPLTALESFWNNKMGLEFPT